MNERTCTLCKQTKPLVAFGHDAGGPDGRNRRCRECRRRSRREYLESEAGKAVRAAYNARPEVKARKKEIDARYARKKRAERDRERREAERRRVMLLVAKVRKGRDNAARKLAAAKDEARRQHYRKMVAEHDAELARLGVT